MRIQRRENQKPQLMIQRKMLKCYY